MPWVFPLNYVTHLGIRTGYLELSDGYAAGITCTDTLYFVSMLRGILWCCTKCETYHRIALWSRRGRNPHCSRYIFDPGLPFNFSEPDGTIEAIRVLEDYHSHYHEDFSDIEWT